MFIPPVPPNPRSTRPAVAAPPRLSGLPPLVAGACALTLGAWVMEGVLLPGSMAAEPPATAPETAKSAAKTTRTRDIAARLLPCSQETRQQFLKSFAAGRSGSTQLADSFEGSWYVHEGDLMVDGDFHSDLNLVVQGNLIVRGTVNDLNDPASLVVMGDLLAHHVLSRQLLVVVGSVQCTGLIHADYNDFVFEVWGPALKSRGLVITDRSVRLPDNLTVDFLYNADEAEGKGAADKVLRASLVRWQDEDGDAYRRELQDGKVRWLDEGGATVDSATAKKLKKLRPVPASIEETATVCAGGQSPFPTPAPLAPDWRLDPGAAGTTVAAHASSREVDARVAAAGHPRLPAEWMVRLAADPDAAVRRAVVHQATLPTPQAAALAADADPGVRRQLASAVHAGAFLDALTADPSAGVRRACGSHPALTDAQRRRLLHDPEKAVRARALRYLPVTAAWVKELRGAPEEELVAWAVEHEGDEVVSSDPAMAPAPGDWKKDLADERKAVREAALKKGAPGGMMAYLNENRERYLQDPSDLIRRALAGSVRDSKALEVLAKDPDPHVRRFALDNLAAPAVVLVGEARRLAGAPADWWNTSSDKYIDHSTDVHALLKHPRLPAEAVRLIAAAYPRLYRMEPHRHMPLDVILDRAVMDSAGVEFETCFVKARQAALRPGADPGPALEGLLESGSDFLQSSARMNASTPLPGLLKHARKLVAEGDKYALEEVAQNPRLGDGSPEAAALIELLMQLPDGGADSHLARNPELPVEPLKTLAARVPDDALPTLWQAHGVAP